MKIDQFTQKTNLKHSLPVLLFLLCSCGSRIIDEKYAAAVVKDKLSLSGDVSALDLKGGFSGDKLFAVTSETKKYVVRFINNTHLKDVERDIYNLKVASDAGYGPKIYFTDPSRGIVIMEYLSSKKISNQDLQSNQFYVALAQLLKKIHHGPAFQGNYDVFNRIARRIQSTKSKYGDDVPSAKIEQVIRVIHQVLLPHLITVPCHNDLHLGNMMLCGDEFKAIDYGDAGLADPYFDIAKVEFELDGSPMYRQELLALYLEHKPSAIEKAKLYLMKQVVLIRIYLDDLNHQISPEFVHKYGLIKAPSFGEFKQEYLAGKLDLSRPENKLMFLKAMLNQVFDNFESQEFKNAVNLLSKKDIESKKD